MAETKTIAHLTEPIRRQGQLHYQRPDRLEKRSDAANSALKISPSFERINVVGQQLTIETRRGLRTVDLSAEPLLAALVESLRATLAGDEATLKAAFAVQLSGQREAWQLDLAPLATELSRFIRAVTIRGKLAQIDSVRIVETAGDSSLMDIKIQP